MIEKCLIEHCAPTLASLKAARGGSEKDRSGDYSDRKAMSLICTVGRGRLDS